jgi:hypothetical protein
MPCSLTPVGLLTPGHCSAGVLSPPYPIRGQPQRYVPFGAPSRGLRPRCLRFAGALTGLAHARLASGWWPAFAGQDCYLPGPLRKVSALLTVVYIASPFPRLGLAHIGWHPSPAAPIWRSTYFGLHYSLLLVTVSLYVWSDLLLSKRYAVISMSFQSCVTASNTLARCTA